jgi:hypothetical protein
VAYGTAPLVRPLGGDATVTEDELLDDLRDPRDDVEARLFALADAAMAVAAAALALAATRRARTDDLAAARTRYDELLVSMESLDSILDPAP